MKTDLIGHDRLSFLPCRLLYAILFCTTMIISLHIVFIFRRNAAETKQTIYRNKLRIKEQENKKTFHNIQMRILEQKNKDEIALETKEKGKKEVERIVNKEIDNAREKEREILRSIENERIIRNKDDISSVVVHKARKKVPNSTAFSSSSSNSIINSTKTTPIKNEPATQSTPIGTAVSIKSIQSVNSKSSREMLLLLRKQGGADRKQGGAIEVNPNILSCSRGGSDIFGFEGNEVVTEEVFDRIHQHSSSSKQLVRNRGILSTFDNGSALNSQTLNNQEEDDNSDNNNNNSNNNSNDYDVIDTEAEKDILADSLLPIVNLQNRLAQFGTMIDSLNTEIENMDSDVSESFGDGSIIFEKKEESKNVLIEDKNEKVNDSSFNAKGTKLNNSKISNHDMTIDNYERKESFHNIDSSPPQSRLKKLISENDQEFYDILADTLDGDNNKLDANIRGLGMEKLSSILAPPVASCSSSPSPSSSYSSSSYYSSLCPSPVNTGWNALKKDGSESVKMRSKIQTNNNIDQSNLSEFVRKDRGPVVSGGIALMRSLKNCNSSNEIIPEKSYDSEIRENSRNTVNNGKNDRTWIKNTPPSIHDLMRLSPCRTEGDKQGVRNSTPDKQNMHQMNGKTHQNDESNLERDREKERSRDKLRETERKRDRELSKERMVVEVVDYGLVARKKEKEEKMRKFKEMELQEEKDAEREWEMVQEREKELERERGREKERERDERQRQMEIDVEKSREVERQRENLVRMRAQEIKEELMKQERLRQQQFLQAQQEQQQLKLQLQLQNVPKRNRYVRVEKDVIKTKNYSKDKNRYVNENENESGGTTARDGLRDDQSDRLSSVDESVRYSKQYQENTAVIGGRGKGGERERGGGERKEKSIHQERDVKEKNTVLGASGRKSICRDETDEEAMLIAELLELEQRRKNSLTELHRKTDTKLQLQVEVEVGATFRSGVIRSKTKENERNGDKSKDRAEEQLNDIQIPNNKNKSLTRSESTPKSIRLEAPAREKLAFGPGARLLGKLDLKSPKDSSPIPLLSRSKSYVVPRSNSIAPDDFSNASGVKEKRKGVVNGDDRKGGTHTGSQLGAQSGPSRGLGTGTGMDVVIGVETDGQSAYALNGPTSKKKNSPTYMGEPPVGEDEGGGGGYLREYRKKRTETEGGHDKNGNSRLHRRRHSELSNKETEGEREDVELCSETPDNGHSYGTRSLGPRAVLGTGRAGRRGVNDEDLLSLPSILPLPTRVTAASKRQRSGGTSSAPCRIRQESSNVTNSSQFESESVALFPAPIRMSHDYGSSGALLRPPILQTKESRKVR